MKRLWEKVSGTARARAFVVATIVIVVGAAVSLWLINGGGTQEPTASTVPSATPTESDVDAIGVELSSGDPARVAAVLSGSDSNALPADMVPRLSDSPIEFDYSTMVSLGYDSVQIQGIFEQQEWLFYLTLSEDAWVVVLTEAA